MNQELINQIIKQLETLSLESMRLTQELKAIQETTGTITKRKKRITHSSDIHKSSPAHLVKNTEETSKTLDPLTNKNEQSRRRRQRIRYRSCRHSRNRNRARKLLRKEPQEQKSAERLQNNHRPCIQRIS